MTEIMDEVIEHLAKNKTSSETKSYLIGLGRGRIWASNHADYFEIKEWSETKPEEFKDFVLPNEEKLHFKILQSETPLDWKPYVKGWVDGVKEISSEY